jgi:thioesterase domain-containing protein
MVPAHLVALAALPQTPNGKLDRKALPAPETVRVETPVGAETPNDPLEAMLVAAWEKVLGFQPIRKTDDFFEIGGHSVLAARLFARMEKIIGKMLPLATLFQAPTVEKLARLLRDSGWTPPWSSLVPIRPGGSKTPFYFVHPIGGNVLNFSGFAGHFDADQPIYGLQARGLDGKHAPNTSVLQMAEDYIADIRSVQPEGPYYIGGFSAGGVVAYEMARQLRAQGQKVAVLALLDTPAEITGDPFGEASGRLLARWIRIIRFNALYAFRVGLATFAGYKIRNWRMRGRIRLWTLRAAMTGHADPTRLNVEEAFLVALRNYTPAPYEGDATLFRAKDDLVNYSDPTLGWGKLVQGRLEIREISGDHDTILHEPHIGMLARVLDSCLHAVQASARGMNTLRQSA